MVAGLLKVYRVAAPAAFPGTLFAGPGLVVDRLLEWFQQLIINPCIHIANNVFAAIIGQAEHLGTGADITVGRHGQ